jgi:hypothetical protein
LFKNKVKFTINYTYIRAVYKVLSKSVKGLNIAVDLNIVNKPTLNYFYQDHLKHSKDIVTNNESLKDQTKFWYIRRT